MIIFLPIVVSVFIYIFNTSKLNYIAFIVQGVISVLFYKLLEIVLTEGIIKFTLGGWTKQIGIEFKIDVLTLIFMAMAIIIWWVIMIYAWHQKKNDFKFLFFLMFLEGCFLAFVQVNDLFTLFILIEIITIISAILILYKKDGISLKAGLYYLLFNSIGMIVYLFGLALIYLKVGTLNMTLIKAYLISQDFMSLDYSIIQVSFACFLVSMCIKSALFPVYDWLPRAHTAAPSHISALLSGLLVKSGLFGLIRILDIYHVESVYIMLFYLGFFTAISGILFAISQKDIKGILAFHTISQIGLIMMSLSTNSDIGLLGAYMHIFNHFLFKSLLFLGAGIIINEYGLRRVSEIHGIGRAHPLLTLCMMIGIFSITGAPLFVGFLSKSVIKLSMVSPLHINLFKIVSLGTMISFIKFSKIFFGEPTRNKKINKGQHLSVTMLAALCVFFFIKELDIMRVLLPIDGLMSEKLTYSLNYVEKSLLSNEYVLEYFAYFAVAYVSFKVLVHQDSKFWHAIRHFRMKFQDAVVSLLIFLVLMINYL
jgi:multicomponent Na+:H+ antiporter subunit D